MNEDTICWFRSHPNMSGVMKPTNYSRQTLILELSFVTLQHNVDLVLMGKMKIIKTLW